MNERDNSPGKPRYLWPRFVLVALILAIVLAILWMSFAVRRLQQYRDPNPFPPDTKPAVPAQ